MLLTFHPILLQCCYHRLTIFLRGADATLNIAPVVDSSFIQQKEKGIAELFKLGCLKVYPVSVDIKKNLAAQLGATANFVCCLHIQQRHYFQVGNASKYHGMYVEYVAVQEMVVFANLCVFERS